MAEVTHPRPRTRFGFLFYGAAGIALGLVGFAWDDLEPEVDAGEGRPRWALEQGINLLLRNHLQLDLGFNTGVASKSKAHFGYLGMGIAF